MIPGAIQPPADDHHAHEPTTAIHGDQYARFLQSFVFAFQGVRYTLRTQFNMRVHLSLAILAIAMGIWLDISPVEFAMIFIAITLVIVSEMVNTVIEACVDLVTREYHPLAKVAKDVAAGVVLVNAVLSLIIAAFVFGPHLWTRIAVTWLHH